MSEKDDVDDIIARLERARADRDAAAAGLEPHDDAAVDRLQDAYVKAVGLLDSYEDKATESGDFSGYVEFRNEFTSFLSGLSDDLPHRSDFEDAGDRVDKRRLSSSDFDAARAELATVAGLVEALEDKRQWESEISELRRTLTRKRTALEDERDRLKELASVDPTVAEADIEELRDPIDRFNDAITADHREFLRNASIRSVFETYDRIARFPLVDIDEPPEDLVAFFEDHPVGEESVGRVRELLSYSRSKLAHYVEDAGHFLGEVKPYAGYLDGLSPDPFTIDWVPPEGDTFEWALGERRRAVDRFASDDTMAILRELEEIVRDRPRYERLRDSAIYRDSLEEADLELVRSGDVADQLEEVADKLERIDHALE